MKLDILIVDDESDIIDSVGQVVRSMDPEYSVHPFDRAQEAFHYIKNNHVDVVITDIKMPGMSGLELLSEIKKVKDGVQVIVMSGHGDLDAVMKCIRNHAADFLAKPFQVKDLKTAVRGCVLNLSKWEADDEQLIRLAAMENSTVAILDQAYTVMKDVYVYTKLVRKMSTKKDKISKELDKSIESMERLFEQIYALKSGESVPSTPAKRSA